MCDFPLYHAAAGIITPQVFFCFFFLRAWSFKIDFSIYLLSWTFLKSSWGFWKGVFLLFCQHWHFALAEESQEQLIHAERNENLITLFRTFARFEKKDFGARLAGSAGLVGAWCLSLAFSSFDCFHCLNFLEPSGGKLPG